MTKTFRALCVGDLHLDKLAKLFPDNHLQLQFNEITKVCSYAINNGYDRIIFLGDIGENPRLSYEALCAFIDFLSKWDEHLKFDFILGNHDFAETGIHSLQPFVNWQKKKFYKNIKIYDKAKLVEIDGVQVNYSSYPSTTGYDNAINIGHFEVSGSTRDNGMIIKKSHNVNPEHLWVMGHLHTPHQVKNVWFAGTLFQLNFGEGQEKSFLAIEAKMRKGKLKTKIERIECSPEFKLFNLTVNSKSDLKKIEKNDLYKYRLLVKSSFDLPENLTEKYKNIVKIEGYKNKKELEALKTSSFLELTAQTIDLPSNKDLLKIFFKSKGYPEKYLKRALKLIKRKSHEAVAK
jgi:DNA repair exonuclease SbcCD nuclease subunit